MSTHLPATLLNATNMNVLKYVCFLDINWQKQTLALFNFFLTYRYFYKIEQRKRKRPVNSRYV